MVLSQAAVVGLPSDLTNVAAVRAAIIFYFMAMHTLPIGMFTIPFTYGAEIAPLCIRHKITARSAATSWTSNFMVATRICEYLMAHSIAATSAAGCAVLFLFYPKTKGRSLEEIDEIFLQSQSIFEPIKMAETLPVGLAVMTTIEA